MTLYAGLDLNATRLRGVDGSPTSTPQPLVLEAAAGGPLPLALNLEGRRPEVGLAGFRICRRLPHLACLGFVQHVAGERRWSVGRHNMDADQALAVAFKQVKPALADVAAAALAVPSYLTREQNSRVLALAKQAKLPIRGWVSAPLALVATAWGVDPWFGPALVLDVDDHALTWAAVTVDEPPAPRQARLLALQTAPGLGLRVWKETLLNGLADRCVRQSRRDPREFADTEQAAWEQFDSAMEKCRQAKFVDLVVQTERYYQDIVLQPEEFEGFCGGLVKQALAGVDELLEAAKIEQPPSFVLATAAAARLPGLLNTLTDASPARTHLVTLAADAVSQAALDLAIRWEDKTLPAGPIDRVIPLRKSGKPLARSAKPVAKSNTKLPARSTKQRHGDEDDFSVTIDE